MAVNILERVIRFGEENGSIKWTTIGNLDKSCCSTSTIDIVDFDYFKTEFQKKKQVQHYKSCDALKIVHTRLDFIEMKGFKNRFQNPNVRPEQQKTKKQ